MRPVAARNEPKPPIRELRVEIVGLQRKRDIDHGPPGVAEGVCEPLYMVHGSHERAHGGFPGWAVVEFTRRMAMGAAASEPRYYVGVDLGQSRDPTAIAIVRRLEPPRRVPDDDFGLQPKPNYARGSLEWQEEPSGCQDR